jgi:hypothetical protein
MRRSAQILIDIIAYHVINRASWWLRLFQKETAFANLDSVSIIWTGTYAPFGRPTAAKVKGQVRLLSDFISHVSPKVRFAWPKGQ